MNLETELQAIQDTLQLVESAVNFGNTEAAQNLTVEAIERYIRLEAWLKANGVLPDDWEPHGP